MRGTGGDGGGLVFLVCFGMGMNVCTKLNPDIKDLIVKSVHLAAILVSWLPGSYFSASRPGEYLLLGKDPKTKKRDNQSSRTEMCSLNLSTACSLHTVH